MKTGIQMLQDVVNYLVLKGADKLINGDIRIQRRPKNSQKEDIVVGGIALTAQQQQQGVLNVNIHVPDMVLNIEGVEDTQPNIKRFDEIGSVIADMLFEVHLDDFWFYSQNTGSLIPDDDGSLFINIRLNYFTINNNFN